MRWFNKILIPQPSDLTDRREDRDETSRAHQSRADTGRSVDEVRHPEAEWLEIDRKSGACGKVNGSRDEGHMSTKAPWER
jgi:hypothetical protein